MNNVQCNKCGKWFALDGSLYGVAVADGPSDPSSDGASQGCRIASPNGFSSWNSFSCLAGKAPGGRDELCAEVPGGQVGCRIVGNQLDFGLDHFALLNQFPHFIVEGENVVLLAAGGAARGAIASRS